LVKELLDIEGYKADVMSKRAFPSFADADVKASRSDTCATVNLLVQVKHHQGYSNQHGLAQLEEIRKSELPEWNDHELVFCTSASVSPDFLSRAEDQDITVIDGKGLVDWIYQHIDSLSNEWKNRLGICEVPTVIGVR
jgi:restriction system protein